MTPRKKPSTELATFPLMTEIYRGELIDEETKTWKNGIDPDRLDRAVTTAERLYPELHREAGKQQDHRFDPAVIIAKTQAKRSLDNRKRRTAPTHDSPGS